MPEAAGTGYQVIGIKQHGTFVGYDPDPLFRLGLGLWLPRDDQTVEVVYNVQRPARFEETVLAEKMLAADYVPEPHAFLPMVVCVWLEFQVRVAGNTLSGFGSMEVRDGDSIILAGAFGAGTRLIPTTT